MAEIIIPLGPSAFLSENQKRKPDGIQGKINVQNVEGQYIKHLGITYSGNPNCPYDGPTQESQGNWPFYFEITFANDDENPVQVYLNKRGILDIQDVPISKVQLVGDCPEPAKLNIEFEWKV